MLLISLLVRHQNLYPYEQTFSTFQVILADIVEYLNLHENYIADKKEYIKKTDTFI